MDSDVIIVGAGLVGCSAAVALSRLGLNVQILEKHLPEHLVNSTNDRPLSLALGSQRILSQLRIWRALVDGATPIKKVDVSERGRFGRLVFDAADYHEPALGYVVSFNQLQQSLFHAIENEDHVQLMTIENLEQLRCDHEGAQVIVKQAGQTQTLKASLLVAADGAESRCRELLRITTQTMQQGEVAVIAELELARDLQQTAYERFSREGTLAILPLPEAKRCRLVWTMTEADAASKKDWQPAQWINAITELLGHYLGRIKSCNLITKFPLKTILATEQIRPGAVLLGNAAHTIYPLAAQGFNLALRDIGVLADVLRDGIKTERAVGDFAQLERYMSLRKSDQRRIVQLTQGISTLFNVQFPGFGTLRGLGLLATALCSPIKQRLAMRLMGLAGYIPRWARR